MKAFGQWAVALALGLPALAFAQTGSPAGAVPAARRQKPTGQAQAAARPPKAAAKPLAFRGVTVVDVETGQLLSGYTVFIEQKRIRRMGKDAEIRLPSGTQVVEAQGKYLIPGLWNMHAHVDKHGDIEMYYQDYIANGITGAREMSQDRTLDSMQRWRREIAAGQRVGPRATGLGSRLWGGNQGNSGGETYVSTPEEATAAVEALKASGVDFIKMYAGVSREVYFAITAAARRLGVLVTGHPQDVVTAIEASDSGQRSIEHLYTNYFPCAEPDDSSMTLTPECVEFGKHTVKNETWIDPTLVRLAPLRSFGFGDFPDLEASDSNRGCRPGTLSADPPDRIEQARTELERLGRVVRRMHQVGVSFLAGSDGGHNLDVLGCAVHAELAAFVEVGLTPVEALRTATLNPAKFFKATDSLGTIAPGKLADVVLLDANPLADIHNTTRIRAVVADGRYFDRAALDALWADVAKQRHALTQAGAGEP